MSNYARYSGLAIIARQMKRLVVLLLMFVLPLQISWAVAGSYCTHEQSSATQHFGHHAHVHQAHPDDGDSQSALKDHPDCSSCHAVTFSVLDGCMKLVALSRSGEGLPGLISVLPSVPPGEPERPKWYPAV